MEGTLTSQWYPLVLKELFVLYVEALPVSGEGVHTSVYFRDHFPSNREASVSRNATSREMLSTCGCVWSSWKG